MKSCVNRRFADPKPTVNPTGTSTIKYEHIAARHTLYIELNGQSRRLEFPDEITAHNFAMKMKVYLKLKG